VARRCSIGYRRDGQREAQGSQAAAGATETGASTDDTQLGASISVVVSLQYTAGQVMKTIQTREQWLDWYFMPRDFFMRDGTDRQGFLGWVRGEYEQTELQLRLQNRDFGQGGQSRVKNGKRQRWCRELQRRCGSKQLWELVSFTGRFDPEWLRQRLKEQDANENTGAVQPTAKAYTWHQKAIEARSALRWGNHLTRKRARIGEPLMNKPDRILLQQFDNGDLRRRVNELTVLTGNGRLRCVAAESTEPARHGIQTIS